MSEMLHHGGGLMTLGQQSGVIATSLDMADPSARAKMVRAMQDCDARLTESVNMPIKAVDYLAHEVDIVSSETGEVARCVRLVLIDADGLTYECVSATLLKSLQTVAFAYGQPPWTPPIALIVRTKKRGERSIYFFDVAT